MRSFKWYFISAFLYFTANTGIFSSPFDLGNTLAQNFNIQNKKTSTTLIQEKNAYNPTKQNHSYTLPFNAYCFKSPCNISKASNANWTYDGSKYIVQKIVLKNFIAASINGFIRNIYSHQILLDRVNTLQSLSLPGNKRASYFLLGYITNSATDGIYKIIITKGEVGKMNILMLHNAKLLGIYTKNILVPGPFSFNLILHANISLSRETLIS